MNFSSNFPSLDGRDRLRVYIEKEQESCLEQEGLTPVVIHGYIDSVEVDAGEATAYGVMVTKVDVDFDVVVLASDIYPSPSPETLQ